MRCILDKIEKSVIEYLVRLAHVLHRGVFFRPLSGGPCSANSLSFFPVAGISLFMPNQFSSPIKNFPITHTQRAHISHPRVPPPFRRAKINGTR